jgi:hypothetical protein
VAGTDDHSSIDSLDWLLITAAIALVMRYMHHDTAAAQEFLLAEVSAKHILYRYHGKLEFDGPAFPEYYFWQRNKFVRHEITASGTVIRTGAALVPAKRSGQSVPRSKRWRVVYMASDEGGYVLDVKRSATARMPLVQLHRDDIVRRLREMGFMSASDSTSAQQELPLPAPPPSPPSSPSSGAQPPGQLESVGQKSPPKSLSPKEWLFENFVDVPPEELAKNLHDVHDRINDDKSVRT